MNACFLYDKYQMVNNSLYHILKVFRNAYLSPINIAFTGYFSIPKIFQIGYIYKNYDRI